MQAAPLITAFMSAAGSMYQSSQMASAQREAAREQRRMSELNASAIEAETSEQARRMKGDIAQKEATARARAAASGASVEGTSVGTYLEELSAEDQAQLDWLVKSGQTRAGITREEGVSAEKAGMAQAGATKTAGTIEAGQSMWGGVSEYGTQQGW